jgi:hypothetical protein
MSNLSTTLLACATWHNKPFQHLHVACLINSSSLGHKFKVDDTSVIKKKQIPLSSSTLTSVASLTWEILTFPLHGLVFWLRNHTDNTMFHHQWWQSKKLSSWSCSAKSMHKVRCLFILSLPSLKHLCHLKTLLLLNCVFTTVFNISMFHLLFDWPQQWSDKMIMTNKVWMGIGRSCDGTFQHIAVW